MQTTARTRVLRFAALPLLLATSVTVGCRDSSPTPTAHGATAGTLQATHRPPSIESVTIPPTGGGSAQVLARSNFPDDIDATFRLGHGHDRTVVNLTEPSDVVVAKVTIAPGGSLGWHTHPGPAIVAVQTGELTIVHAEDCSVQRYAAGKAFIDAGQGTVHAGFNAGQGEMVAYVTFLGVPPAHGPTIPAQGPSCE